jgi:hypothetical protein
MLGKFRSGYVSLSQVRSGYFKLGQVVRLFQGSSLQLRLCAIRSCYVSLSQVSSGFVRLGLVISCQVNLGFSC